MSTYGKKSNEGSNAPSSEDAEFQHREKTTKGGIILVPQPSDDPRDPLNWSMMKKCSIFAVMIFSMFTALASVVANVLATPVQAETWHVSLQRAAYSISPVLGGGVVGPILLVPLVRIFGVMSCCFWSMIFVTVTSVWSAVSTEPSSYGSFLGARFVAGIFAAAPSVFISGVIVNLFFQHQRGRAFAIYATVYMMAQVSGATFSGYIVQFVRWPVVFWWTVAADGVAALLIFLFGEDTTWDRKLNQPLTKKRIPDSWLARRVFLFLPGISTAPPKAYKSIPRALVAIFAICLSPVTILCGIFATLGFGWYVMAGVQVPIILQTPVAYGGYGFSPLETSNLYWCAWIGALIGILYGISLNDRLPLWLQKRNNGVWHAEYRLYPSFLPGLIVGPIGYGVFGAVVYFHWHWIVIAVGLSMIVFSAASSIPPSVNYIIEIWQHYPQEVGAAVNIWRLGLGVGAQFFYQPWAERVGVNWAWGAASLIAVFGFACVALCIWKGPLLRKADLWPEDYNPYDDKVVTNES